MSTNLETKGDWLVSWNPEDESKWDSKLAWHTLTVTTFTLTLCFVAWFLPSAIIPKLSALGYTFTKSQLYWMAAMPGLSGGLLRLVWMVLPPKIGTRKLVTLTTLLLILPVLGWVASFGCDVIKLILNSPSSPSSLRKSSEKLTPSSFP